MGDLRNRTIMEVVWGDSQKHPDFAEGFRAARRGEVLSERDDRSPEYRSGWAACYDVAGVATWVRAAGFGLSLDEIADAIERGDWIPGFAGTRATGAELN